MAKLKHKKTEINSIAAWRQQAITELKQKKLLTPGRLASINSFTNSHSIKYYMALWRLLLRVKMLNAADMDGLMERINRFESNFQETHDAIVYLHKRGLLNLNRLSSIVSWGHKATHYSYFIAYFHELAIKLGRPELPDQMFDYLAFHRAMRPKEQRNERAGMYIKEYFPLIFFITHSVVVSFSVLIHMIALTKNTPADFIGKALSIIIQANQFTGNLNQKLITRNLRDQNWWGIISGSYHPPCGSSWTVKLLEQEVIIDPYVNRTLSIHQFTGINIDAHFPNDLYEVRGSIRIDSVHSPYVVDDIGLLPNFSADLFDINSPTVYSQYLADVKTDLLELIAKLASDLNELQATIDSRAQKVLDPQTKEDSEFYYNSTRKAGKFSLICGVKRLAEGGYDFIKPEVARERFFADNNKNHKREMVPVWPHNTPKGPAFFKATPEVKCRDLQHEITQGFMPRYSF